jgi:hypothetical protein
MYALLWIVLGCGSTTPSSEERTLESPNTGPLVSVERPDMASDVDASAKPTAITYSISRRLSDFANDNPAYGGETLDTWTCHQDGSCTSEGFTDVAMAEGVRIRVEWRGDYDPRGYPIRLYSRFAETGRPDVLEIFEFADGAVRIITEDASGRVIGEYVLPPRFRPCLLACQEQVAQAGETNQSCHAVYPDGVRRHDSTVRPVAHPKLGAVWEWKTFKPESGIEDVRLVDANCQQLEARINNLRSILLSEERTGEPRCRPTEAERVRACPF